MARKSSSINVYSPTGTIIAVSGNVPEGYLPCDGSYVSIATYQALYNTLTNDGQSNNPYGTDVGNTFKLPDLRGRVPSGGTQNQTANTLGIGTVSGENVSDLNTNSSTIAVAADGNIQSNYTANATAGAAKGNFSCNIGATSGKTGTATISSTNMPAHAHNHPDMQVTNNYRGNRAISGLNRGQNNRTTATNVNYTYIDQTLTNNTTNNAGTNKRVRTQTGRGNTIRVNQQNAQLANQTRFTGQNAGETFARTGHQIHKQNNAGNEVNAARWASSNTNNLLWREMAGSGVGTPVNNIMGKAHDHQISNSMQGVVYNNGNLAGNMSGNVNVTADGVPQLTASSAKITYGDLRGKQVLVLYAIKY